MTEKKTTTRKRPAKKATPRPRKTTQPTLTPVPEPDQAEEEAVPGPALDEQLQADLAEHLNSDQIAAITPILANVFAAGTARGQQTARNIIAGDLRFLAQARADYDTGTAPETLDAGQKAACIRAEHVAAEWLAGIIDLSRPASGWMPSWRWPEWIRRMADQGFEIRP